MTMHGRLIRRCALAVARRLRCPRGVARFTVNCRVVALLAIAFGGACGLVADAGAVTNLGALANDDTRAHAISGDGSVVGGGGYDGNFNQAFRWSSGTMSPLGSLAGDAYAVTPSPNPDPGLVRESSRPAWGLKGFSDEEATQCRADRGLASAG